MATDRVRLVTYVDADLAAIVDETAAALGQSRSSMLAEVVQNAGPVLAVIRDMARDLAEAPERHREYLERFAASLRPMADEASQGLAGLEALASTPAPSNTGVRR